MIERAFAENLHPRGTGAQGGQFVAGSAGAAGSKAPARKRATAGRPRPAGNLSFDGRRGPGYGQKNGDRRVKDLQTALNRLGLTDSSGKRLAVDGKLGPKTTAAIKKAQRKLGLKADGVVTPALLAKLTKAKKLEKAKKVAAPAKKVMPAKKAAPAPARKVAPAPQRRGRGGAKAAPRTIQVGRHAMHNQASHGNRLGRPTNVPGKTGLARVAADLSGKPALGPLAPDASLDYSKGMTQRPEDLTSTQAKTWDVVAQHDEIEEGAARQAGANLTALRTLERKGLLSKRQGTFRPKSGPYAGQELPTTYYRVKRAGG
jgi:peptidoglycan hydrolase-like protein with peptidoglycan-binding domain